MRGYAGSSLFHTGTGEPQKRLRVIDQSRAFSSHLPNWPSLDVVGHPADLLVELEHPLLERGHLDEPRRDALVDQGLAAAPAVRVGVVVGLAAQQDRARRDRRRSPPLPSVAALRWSMICRLASKTSIPA